jgi:hypothetical protein
LLTNFNGRCSALFLILSNFGNIEIMGIFKLRKNKRYDYTPRYYKGKAGEKPFEIKQKFDDYRKTVGNTGGLKTRFSNAMDDLKGNPDRAATRRILFIVAALLLIFLFIIDFDLSIFFR